MRLQVERQPIQYQHCISSLPFKTDLWSASLGETRSNTMRQNVGKTLEASLFELWRRASKYGDLEAWGAFQQSLEETVLTWLHQHPGRGAACPVYSERHSIAQAFEQW